MITLNTVYKVNPEEVDEIWVIVRSANKLPDALKNNPKVKHVPELLPSRLLFSRYLDWKNKGEWDEAAFLNYYVPRFLLELQNEKSRNLLQQLVEESKTKNIALVCFCYDETLCHHSIIGGILMNMGANVQCNEKYKMFKPKEATSLVEYLQTVLKAELECNKDIHKDVSKEQIAVDSYMLGLSDGRQIMLQQILLLMEKDA